MYDLYVIAEGTNFWKRVKTYKTLGKANGARARMLNSGKYERAVVTLHLDGVCHEIVPVMQ